MGQREPKKFFSETHAKPFSTKKTVKWDTLQRKPCRIDRSTWIHVWSVVTQLVGSQGSRTRQPNLKTLKWPCKSLNPYPHAFLAPKFFFEHSSLGAKKDVDILLHVSLFGGFMAFPSKSIQGTFLDLRVHLLTCEPQKVGHLRPQIWHHARMVGDPRTGPVIS